MVVAVAMIGSLTVLPALLSWLGDRVEKGRDPVPRAGSRRDDGEGRVWGAILDAVLRRPLVSAIAVDGACSLALALPALSLHTAQSGLDALPKSLDGGPGLSTRCSEAFPGGADAGDRRDQGGRVRPGASRPRSRELKRQALASGQALEPIDVETSPDGTRSIRVDDPARRRAARTRRRTPRSTTLRNEILPATVGTVAGRRVRGHRRRRPASKDWNEQMKSSAPLVFAFVLALRVPAAAGLVPLDRDPDQGDRAEPALGRRRLRRARRWSSSAAGARTCSASSRTAASPRGCRCSCS